MASGRFGQTDPRSRICLQHPRGCVRRAGRMQPSTSAAFNPFQVRKKPPGHAEISRKKISTGNVVWWVCSETTKPFCSSDSLPRSGGTTEPRQETSGPVFHPGNERQTRGSSELSQLWDIGCLLQAEPGPAPGLCHPSHTCPTLAGTTQHLLQLPKCKTSFL